MQTNELAVSYEVNGEQLTITEHDVRNVLGAPTATPAEIRMFLELCRTQGLNPFIKEAYIIKYGNQAATLVVGKDVFTKRAQKNPRFEGMEAGLTLLLQDGSLIRRPGSMILPGETPVGAWCNVFVKGYQRPIYEEVSYQEYVATKYDKQTGQWVPNKQWQTKPGTMLRKVAIVHALREAFPDDFQGLYDEAEMGNLEPPAPTPLERVAEIVASEPVITETIPMYEPQGEFDIQEAELLVGQEEF